jgi:hypothetical protein
VEHSVLGVSIPEAQIVYSFLRGLGKQFLRKVGEWLQDEVFLAKTFAEVRVTVYDYHLAIVGAGVMRLYTDTAVPTQQQSAEEECVSYREWYILCV